VEFPTYFKFFAPLHYWEEFEDEDYVNDLQRQYDAMPDVFWYVQEKFAEDFWVISSCNKSEGKMMFDNIWEARYYALLLSKDPDNLYGDEEEIETRTMKFTKSKLK